MPAVSDTSTAMPATPSMRPPSASGTDAMRWLAFASLAALVVLGIAWEAWLAPTGRGTLAIKVLPLALALPGVWRRRLYTYRWLSLLVWLYFIEGVVRAWGDRGTSAWLAGAEIALCLLLFAACATYVRQRLREDRAAAAAIA